MYVCVCVLESGGCCKKIYIYMVVYKRIRKSCLMFEFCLRNQKKKKQRILFSGFGFVSLFTNFIFAHTHTHTYTYTYTSTYFVTIDTTTLKYFCFKFRCSSSLLVVFVYIIDIIYIYINFFFPGFVNFF